jgi:ubiquinone/menaquinone biosynthesis C-methylase UbiE
MFDQSPANVASPALLHARAWAEVYELIDLQLSPLGMRAIEALAPRAGDIVLDIGCGAGQTLLQLAERVGTKGQVIGVDVAPLLLDIAKRRAAPFGQVKLIEADAQVLDSQVLDSQVLDLQVLDFPAESADAVFSRFGVMSFNDPVAAFTNVRRLLKPSGALAFCCWRSLAENELDHLPLRAAGMQSALDERPFSFADPEYIRRTLAAAGFGEIVIQSHNEKVSSGDLDAMTSVLLRVGALGKIVRENPVLRASAEPLLREALARLGDPASVHLLAAVWIVTARRTDQPPKSAVADLGNLIANVG